MTRARRLGHPALRRLLACALLAGLLLALDAGPASAHAILESSDPTAGATLTSAPKQVTLRFDESVRASLGAIRLFDGRGNRIDVGAPFHPGGAGGQVAASLPALRDGSYVVTWRVISADSHPVQGAFTMTVGNAAPAGDVTGLANRLLTEEGGSTTVGVIYGIARFLVFASIALLVGAVVLLVTAWPSGRRSRRAARLVWGAWAVLLVSTLAAYALQGAYAAALPLTDTLHLSQLRNVWHTRFGEATLLRAAVLVLAIPLLRQLLAPPAGDADTSRDAPTLPRWWYVPAVVAGLVVVATPGLGGHASTGRWRWLAFPADVVHVAAMATWLGGLALVLACVLPVSDPALLRRVVPRFSRVAMWCIVAIVATGSFQAWRQIGSLHAFTSTDYGRLLLVKLAGVVVILAGAALSREVVKRRLRHPYEPDVVRADVPVAVGVGGVGAGGGGGDASDDGDWDDDQWTEEDEERAEVHRLRLSVAVEVAVAVFVLAVTAVLVNAPPAYTASNLPYIKTLEKQGRFYDITMTPGKAGPNDVHVTALTPNGGPSDVIKYNVTFAEPGKGVAPITVPLLRLGPGHYASYAFRVPFPGTWQMTVSALISDTEETTFTLKVPIH